MLPSSASAKRFAACLVSLNWNGAVLRHEREPQLVCPETVGGARVRVRGAGPCGNAQGRPKRRGKYATWAFLAPPAAAASCAQRSGGECAPEVGVSKTTHRYTGTPLELVVGSLPHPPWRQRVSKPASSPQSPILN